MPKGKTEAVEGRSPRSFVRGERGDSLVEVLVATSIAGIALVGILAGLSTVTITAAAHNEGVLLESALSQAKQSLATQPYTSVPLPTCAPVYSLPTVSGVTFQECVTPITSPTPLPLQQVTITATGSRSTRSTTLFKSDR